jgi:hypothetical protein
MARPQTVAGDDGWKNVRCALCGAVVFAHLLAAHEANHQEGPMIAAYVWQVGGDHVPEPEHRPPPAYTLEAVNATAFSGSAIGSLSFPPD